MRSSIGRISAPLPGRKAGLISDGLSPAFRAFEPLPSPFRAHHPQHPRVSRSRPHNHMTEGVSGIRSRLPATNPCPLDRGARETARPPAASPSGAGELHRRDVGLLERSGEGPPRRRSARFRLGPHPRHQAGGRDRHIFVRHPALASLLAYALKHAPGEDLLFPSWSNVRRDLPRRLRAGRHRALLSERPAPHLRQVDAPGPSSGRNRRSNHGPPGHAHGRARLWSPVA